jgi:rod shape determining protein RodA
MFEFLKGRLIPVRLILLAAGLLLIAVGVATIYSVGNPVRAVASGRPEVLTNYWKKQIIFAAVGMAGFIAVNLFNYRRLGQVSYSIYGVILVLLGVLLVGKFTELSFVPMINGTHRWIRFNIFGRQLPAIQPSEFCKLAYVAALAWYLRYRSNYRKFSSLIGPFALTLLAMVLILLEPDLGTVMLMMPILFTMLFVAGAKVKHLAIIVLMAILVSPLLWWQMVREKAEQNRKFGEILVGRDKTVSTKEWKNNWGYHLIRSKYAVAGGGLNGYGFRQGPFIKYNFLPERHNDFIFSAIGHQFGFRGCVALLALYVIIVVCGLEIAANNSDPFGRLLAVGIVAMFAVEVVVNVSMTMGLMPITGLTLPLVSYGGSSLLVSMMALGLLNNIGRCRPFSVAKKAFE